MNRRRFGFSLLAPLLARFLPKDMAVQSPKAVAACLTDDGTELGPIYCGVDLGKEPSQSMLACYTFYDSKTGREVLVSVFPERR